MLQGFKNIPIYTHKTLEEAPKGHWQPYYQVYICPDPNDKVVKLALKCGKAFQEEKQYLKAIKTFREHLRTLDLSVLAKWTSVLTILPLEKVNHATGEGSYIHIANRITREEALEAWIENWKAKNNNKSMFTCVTHIKS